MALRMIVYCAGHEDAPAVPAGDTWHWMPLPEKSGQYEVFELDEGDLYCTAEPDGNAHQFIVSVFADKPDNFAGTHADNLGIDIIVTD